MISSLNTYLQPFLEWLLRTTLQATLLICLILLIQAVLGNRLGARWRYCLWLVLFVRMAMPWAPQSHISVFNLLPQSLPFGHGPSIFREPSDARVPSVVASGAEESREGKILPSMRASDRIKTVDVPALHAPQMPQDKASFELSRLAGLLPLLWLAGASALTGYILLSNILLWRIVRSERPLTDQGILDLLEDCKDQISTHVILAVVATDKVNTPALFGFVRPRLLLPRAMIEELTLSELRYIFLHELAHLKRHDIFIGYIASLLHVLHWFNPVIWFGFRRVRADRELATDALAMSSMKADETPRYGHAIIHQLERFLESRRLPSLAGLSESKTQIRRRMTMIARFRNNSYRWSSLGIAVIMVFSTISMIDPRRGTVSASPAPQANPPMTVRLVEKDSGGSVSPDGRYLCSFDWREGAIAIREFATGEKRRIKPPEGTPDGKPYWWPLLMSPDNKAVACSVWTGGTGYLYLVEADGSGQRVLCHNVIPAQWFPDGSRILGILWPGPETNDARDIVSVSVSDGSVQKIKYLKSTVGGSSPLGLSLSPDAQYIASDVPQEDHSGKCDIVAVEIDSKQEIPLVQDPADDRLLDWTPDGRHILFASNRTGGWHAHLLPVAKGKAQGTPDLVVRNVNPSMLYERPKGFAHNGSYYYRVRYDDRTIYTAGIDLTAGRLLSSPAPSGAAGSGDCADWSPDGTRLAYCMFGVPSPVIRIRTLATGEERELIPKVPSIGCLRWSRDGRSFLASGLMSIGSDKEGLEVAATDHCSVGSPASAAVRHPAEGRCRRGSVTSPTCSVSTGRKRSEPPASATVLSLVTGGPHSNASV